MTNRLEGGGVRSHGRIKQSQPGRPLITIITATYNAAMLLPQTIASIRKQSYDNIEYIVIDGASTDGTVNVLRAHEDVIDYWLSEPDTGIYNAWNKALSKAQGEWILFLGAGDALGGGWIESVSKIGDGIDLVYGDMELSRAMQDTNKKVLVRSMPWDHVRDCLVMKMPLPHPGMAHRRNLFEQSVFDESYKIVGDWDFLARVLPKHGHYAAGSVQACVVLSGKSSHASTVPEHYREVMRSLHARNVGMPIKTKLKWQLKRWGAAFPSVYEWLQFRYWQVQVFLRLYQECHGPRVAGAAKQHAKRPEC